MLRTLLLTIGIVLTANLLVFSQSGTLQGTIQDAETGEPIPFANVILELGGTQVGGTTSDFDGNYTIKPIPPGRYDLKATFVGYKTQIVEGVVISANQITRYNVELVSTVAQLEEVEIKSYKVPLISADQTTGGATITAEEIAKMPNRSAAGVAATVGGVFSRDGEAGNIRGARSEGTVTYIDGIKVTGSAALPPSAIEQVSVMLGGLPAMYGDATGGIINVTTKGPSRTFGAGFEVETSEFLDPYGYNRLGFNVNGPIFTRKNDQGQVISSLLGYFLAGDITYRQDGAASAIGIYKAKDDVINFLEDNPLRVSGQASGGTLQNAEFLLMDDLEHVQTTQNTSRYDINLSGKIDVRTTETINLTFGGQYVQRERNRFVYSASLLNFDKNTLINDNTWRVFGRFTQRFPTDKEKNSLFKNVFYSIQVDYSQFSQEFMDPDLKEDIFKYGYLGKFDVYKQPTFEMGADTVNGVLYDNMNLLNSWDFDTLVTFDPSTFNAAAAQWTTSYYNLYDDPFGNYQNFDQIQLGGGLLNGQQPSGVYQLYQSPGTIQSGYGESLTSQIGINASFTADIGNHELKLGFQYEQRAERFYNYGAVGLWPLMRGLTNFHILELDIENPELVYFDGELQDTIIYRRKYDANSQRTFDANLRQKLGLPVDGLDYIVPYSYDFEERSIIYYDENGTRHKAYYEGDLFSIDMFSPDELLNNGTNPYVNYQGFSYTGEKLEGNPTIDDFFTEQDENGMYTRPIGAFEPIYMAGYIQDKFSFRDLIFNVGVRVDRFDANQKVLKDPYSIFPVRTVEEVRDINGVTIYHPENMGNNYAVYVDQIDNPTSIVGYRSGDVWYNAQGIEIQDPRTLTGSTGISPYLVNSAQDRVDINSFEDYEPQWNIMPRISFSFPISDEALFLAHYDVLTQRPMGNNIVSPAIYYYFNEVAGVLDNPNLKPQKTINYEVGFQQKLTNTSSLKMTTFYSEQRDMIQQFRYSYAFPRDYTSYSNLDFGTVKGLTLTYDLRRTNNVRVRASYTLQFTNATGGSPTTAQALISAGLPNLRSTFPVPWDRRHQLNMLLDYRFDEETKSQILKNSGFSLTLNGGSGTPYTASRNINSPISQGTNLLKGTYGGSRLPWQFRMDLRVDKEFYFKFRDSQARESYLNIYLQVLNLMDTKNVINVYPFTGNADDDGYLAAAEWQKQIEQQINPQSFRELYGVFVNRPGNYSMPRMIRLGLIFNL